MINNEGIDVLSREIKQSQIILQETENVISKNLRKIEKIKKENDDFKLIASKYRKKINNLEKAKKILEGEI